MSAYVVTEHDRERATRTLAVAARSDEIRARRDALRTYPEWLAEQIRDLCFAKRREQGRRAQAKYKRTEKGQATEARYYGSDVYKEKQSRYAYSAKGSHTRYMWALRARITGKKASLAAMLVENLWLAEVDAEIDAVIAARETDPSIDAAFDAILAKVLNLDGAAKTLDIESR